jgi:aryl-alcohol dehydrogenase
MEVNEMLIEAAVVRAKGGPFVIEEAELAELKENDVLVKTVSCGVCHTDAAARDQFLPVPLPIVLGHEGAGVVEKVGPAVKTVKAGDHVVMTQNFCGVCEYCRTGHPMSCIHVPDYNFAGVYPDGGTRLKDRTGKALGAFFSQSSFASYAVGDACNTIKVDKDFDLRLAGPLGCGIQTGAGAVINALRPEAGSTLAVFGCGSVGLSAIMAAKVSGCTEIYAVDTAPERLALALELGATESVNGKEYPDSAAEILRRTNGRGTDFSLECAGVPALVNASLHCLKKRGTSGLVGSLGDRDVTSKMMDTIIKNCRRLIGVIEGDSVPQLFIPKLIDLYKKGLFPFDRLITFYDFKDINKAFEAAENGDAIKPVLLF